MIAAAVVSRLPQNRGLITGGTACHVRIAIYVIADHQPSLIMQLLMEV